MYKLTKEEMLYGNQGTARFLVEEAYAAYVVENNKLLMRRANKLRKEIANAQAILASLYAELREARRPGTANRDVYRVRLNRFYDEQKRLRIRELESELDTLLGRTLY